MVSFPTVLAAWVAFTIAVVNLAGQSALFAKQLPMRLPWTVADKLDRLASLGVISVCFAVWYYLLF